MGSAVRELHHLTGLTQKDLRKVLFLFFEKVRDDVLQNGRFEVSGVGDFRLQALAPKRVRHPMTGEWTDVPGKKAIRFRARKGWGVP
jgi:nucleoid DNA-binding protein